MTTVIDFKDRTGKRPIYRLRPGPLQKPDAKRMEAYFEALRERLLGEEQKHAKNTDHGV